MWISARCAKPRSGQIGSLGSESRDYCIFVSSCSYTGRCRRMNQMQSLPLLAGPFDQQFVSPVVLVMVVVVVVVVVAVVVVVVVVVVAAVAAARVVVVVLAS